MAYPLLPFEVQSVCCFLKYLPYALFSMTHYLTSACARSAPTSSELLSLSLCFTLPCSMFLCLYILLLSSPFWTLSPLFSCILDLSRCSEDCVSCSPPQLLPFTQSSHDLTNAIDNDWNCYTEMKPKLHDYLWLLSSDLVWRLQRQQAKWNIMDHQTKVLWRRSVEEWKKMKGAWTEGEI